MIENITSDIKTKVVDLISGIEYAKRNMKE